MRACGATRVACGPTALPHTPRAPAGASRRQPAQVQVPRFLPPVILDTQQPAERQAGEPAPAVAPCVDGSRASSRRGSGYPRSSWAPQPQLAQQRHSCELLGHDALLPAVAPLEDGSSRGRALASARGDGGGAAPSRLGVQLNEPPPRQQQSGDEEQRDKDFFANVGDAIRTLRDDYPLLFAKDLDCAWVARLRRCRAAGRMLPACVHVCAACRLHPLPPPTLGPRCPNRRLDLPPRH